MSTKCPQPVAILWDIENCAIPKDVNAEDVAAGHICLALKVDLAIQGPIIIFSAYGDSFLLPQHVRQACHITGVNLIDIPHGRKDLADKAILVDMFLFALDNPPPCTVVLISGDVDYAPALHKLGQRGYCLVLAIPLGPNVSPALCNACQYVYSWPDIARGKGLNLLKAQSLCMIKDCKPLDVAVQHEKLSYPVESNAKNSSISFGKGKGQDDKPPKAVVPIEKNDSIDVADIKVNSKTNLFTGIDCDTPLEAGSRCKQNGKENPTKIPVGCFKECVKQPFGFADGSLQISTVISNSTTGYNKDHFFRAQSLNGGVANHKFAPPGGQYVCDWFSFPHLENAHVLVGKNKGFDVHQTKADIVHHISGTANVSPSFNMSHNLANRPAECALQDVRLLCKNPNPFKSPHPTNPVVRHRISKRSRKAQSFQRKKAARLAALQ